jgi:hypothetical protein
LRKNSLRAFYCIFYVLYSFYFYFIVVYDFICSSFWTTNLILSYNKVQMKVVLFGVFLLKNRNSIELLVHMLVGVNERWYGEYRQRGGQSWPESESGQIRLTKKMAKDGKIGTAQYYVVDLP